MDLSQITNWFKLPQRVLWALLIVNGLILWGPSKFETGLGLELFIATYRMYIGVGFLLLLAATLPTPIQWVGTLSLKKWRNHKLLKFRKEQLGDLTPEEKKILRHFITYNTKTQELNAIDGVTTGLENAKVIYRAANMSHEYTYFSYNIQPWAWTYLWENPHLLDLADDSQ